MKKIITAVSIVAAALLSAACSGADGLSGGQGGTTTWSKSVATYSFLEYFPAWDGDVENAYYINDSEGETLMFCDYDINKDNLSSYRSKLRSAGFISSDNVTYTNNGMYTLYVIINEEETSAIFEFTLVQ